MGGGERSNPHSGTSPEGEVQIPIGERPLPAVQQRLELTAGRSGQEREDWVRLARRSSTALRWAAEAKGPGSAQWTREQHQPAGQQGGPEVPVLRRNGPRKADGNQDHRDAGNKRRG